MIAVDINESTVKPGAPPETYDEHVQLDLPVSIYEVHLDSWMRVPEEHNRPLTAAEIAPKLADYAAGLDFTHVELLSPPAEGLAGLIETLHQRDIGVILDQPGSLSAAGSLLEQGQLDGLRDGNATFITEGGPGFEMKWDTGWSHTMLDYLGHDPIFRKFHHGDLCRRGEAAAPNDFILPLSHDEMGSGRGSLISQMPGDDWQKFANLRTLLSFQWAWPGKKLLFMGGEFGQWNAWNPDTSLDWHLVREGSRHRGVQQMVGDLNRLYRSEAALQTDAEAGAFELGDCAQAELSIIDWLRRDESGAVILAVFNFTPVPRYNHRLGVPHGGLWREIFNSDALHYGGSGQGNLGAVEASPFGWKRHSYSLTVTLPPLGAVYFKGTEERKGH